MCNLIKCSLLIIALTLAELSSIQTLANQFQFTISKTEDSIAGVMENVVNPCVLIISTHLEESRSVTTKSADFGVDERERHLKVLVCGGSFPPPDEPNITDLGCCGELSGQFPYWHKGQIL